MHSSRGDEVGDHLTRVDEELAEQAALLLVRVVVPKRDGHAARARYAAAVQVWVDDASARNYLCCL